MRALCVSAFALLAAACSPSLKSGWYACTGEGMCPSSWRCISGRCYAPDADAGPPECRVDLHCEDTDPCTEDVCESGYCQHNPQDGACDDGNFCNGPDECQSGHCVNVGPAPCPASCDGTSCAGCGHVGEMCCPGGSCSDGGVCDNGSMMCVGCGATAGAPCCLGAICPAPDLTCVELHCEACGTIGQPCCPGGVCAGGGGALECGGMGTCEPPAGCAGVACPPGETCLGGTGMCVTCGVASKPCCAGASCTDGSACNMGTGFCETDGSCGHFHEPCCVAGPACASVDLVCSDTGGAGCVHCGDPGEQCCNVFEGAPVACNSMDTACDALNNNCQVCGQMDGQLCCGGESCPADPSLTCAGPYCHLSCGGVGEPCCPPGPRLCRTGLTCSGATGSMTCN